MLLLNVRRVALCALLVVPAAAQHADFEVNPLVGTWERVSLLRNSLSVQPPDAALYLKFNADGYWSMMEMPEGRPKVNKPLEEMTKEELFQRFDKVEGGWGYYIVKRDIVNRIHDEDISPGREGVQHIREYMFEDKIMNLAGTGANRSPQARMQPMTPSPPGDTRLVGTWERTSLTMDGKATPPPAPEIILLGEDGWFSQTHLPKGRERIAKPMEEYAKEDFLKAFKNVAAARGTYTVQGSKFTRKHVAAIDPNLVGYEDVREFSLEGDTLTLRGANKAGVKVESKYRRLAPRQILSWSVAPPK
ncbi:MAG: lipocalin-like domain-containing protein [Bryobacterales bacterium]